MQFAELASDLDPSINCRSEGCGTIDYVIPMLPTHKAGL